MKKDKFIQFFINRRKALGYSQNKIANELGISDQAVSNWERGISFPDLSYLDDIAKLLQTNVQSLIMGKQKNIKIKSNINFNSERFSLYISKLRKNKQLTQNDLGKILGISGQNISKFEKGGFLPSIDLIEKYAKYFNVSFLNIYYGLDDFELYEDKQNNISKNKFKWIILSSILIFTIVMLFLIPKFIIKKHTVTIILNDDTTLTYQIKNKESIELPELPIKKGYTVKWDNTNTIITEDTTFTAIYTPNKYTITYSFNNESIDDYIQEVTYNEEFTLYKPKGNLLCEYTYQSDIIESGIYNYDYNIVIDCKVTKLYQITIFLDKDNILTQTVKENTNIELPELPIKKGYAVKWDNTNTIITEDTTFTAIYTPNKYTITYSFNNESIDDYIQEVTYNEEFTLYKPKGNLLCEYTYQSDIIESGIYNYDYNIVIDCKVTKLYQISIFLDKDNILTQTVKENTNIELPELPIKKGYTVKWDNTNTIITKDTTFTAIYTPNKYTITYVYEDNIVDSFTEEVIYGQNYFLTIPMVNNYSFSGYTYNGEIIENDIYYYDHDITVYGEFLQKYYTIYREFANTKYIDYVGNGCSFVLSNIGIDKYLSECPFSPNEYDNYKIIAWKDQNGNIYEVGKTYIYNYNKDIVLCPIFAYYGDAFEIIVNNEEAKIIKYNISKIIELIIPDYIVIDNNKYRVTEIAQGTFQDTYFNNITISSNITKIVKNTFSYDDVHGDSPGGNIYYNGTLQEWFNIDFEEYIVSNKAKTAMMLYTSEFLVGESCCNNNILLIPEGVEVIKSYSIANSRVRELIIPNSVHTIEKYAFINSIFDSITNIENVENVHENAFN